MIAVQFGAAEQFTVFSTWLNTERICLVALTSPDEVASILLSAVDNDKLPNCWLLISAPATALVNDPNASYTFAAHST